MTDHAKRIRHALYSGPQPHLLRVQDRLLDEREALAALDALLAENQRLREAPKAALTRLENVDGNLLLTIYDAQVILRDALAGDAE